MYCKQCGSVVDVGQVYHKFICELHNPETGESITTCPGCKSPLLWLDDLVETLEQPDYRVALQRILLCVKIESDTKARLSPNFIKAIRDAQSLLGVE